MEGKKSKSWRCLLHLWLFTLCPQLFSYGKWRDYSHLWFGTPHATLVMLKLYRRSRIMDHTNAMHSILVSDATPGPSHTIRLLPCGFCIFLLQAAAQDGPSGRRTQYENWVYGKLLQSSKIREGCWLLTEQLHSICRSAAAQGHMPTSGNWLSHEPFLLCWGGWVKSLAPSPSVPTFLSNELVLFFQPLPRQL